MPSSGSAAFHVSLFGAHGRDGARDGHDHHEQGQHEIGGRQHGVAERAVAGGRAVPAPQQEQRDHGHGPDEQHGDAGELEQQLERAREQQEAGERALQHQRALGAVAHARLRRMATAMRPPASTEPLSEPSSVMAMSDAMTTRMACTSKSAAVAMPGVRRGGQAVHAQHRGVGRAHHHVERGDQRRAAQAGRAAACARGARPRRPRRRWRSSPSRRSR
jgi:hypothetical protein